MTKIFLKPCILIPNLTRGSEGIFDITDDATSPDSRAPTRFTQEPRFQISSQTCQGVTIFGENRGQIGNYSNIFIFAGNK